jgi:hypothetical protein
MSAAWWAVNVGISSLVWGAAVYVGNDHERLSALSATAGCLFSVTFSWFMQVVRDRLNKSGEA